MSDDPYRTARGERCPECGAPWVHYEPLGHWLRCAWLHVWEPRWRTSEAP